MDYSIFGQNPLSLVPSITGLKGEYNRTNQGKERKGDRETEKGNRRQRKRGTRNRIVKRREREGQGGRQEDTERQRNNRRGKKREMKWIKKHNKIQG